MIIDFNAFIIHDCWRLLISWAWYIVLQFAASRYNLFARLCCWVYGYNLCDGEVGCSTWIFDLC